jgi:hypothetical protein
MAEWIAMNQIADARLNLNAPLPGVTEGDVKDFGNANWHWRQDIVAIDMIPGMYEIAVRVRRLKPGETGFSSSGGPSLSSPSSLSSNRSASGFSSGAPSSFFSSSGAGYGASSSGSPSGLGQLSASSGAMRKLGMNNLPSAGSNQQWIATMIGFRGDAVSPASGESPDWSCNNSGVGGGICTTANGAGASSSGATSNPNPGINPGSSGISLGPSINPPTQSSGGPQ